MSMLGQVETGKSYFTPISGAEGTGPQSYLLELGRDADDKGGYTVLLDCGWSDKLQEGDLEALKKVVTEREIDCVLLSSACFTAMGALAYLVEKCGLSAPVYATHPVKAMGHIALYDMWNYSLERMGTCPYSEEGIDAAMKLVQPLKFYEVHRLRSKERRMITADDTGHVVISPSAAGHSLGAAIWHIVKDSDEIAYAPTFNHKAEAHLPPADVNVLQKSTVCIASANRLALPPAPADRDKRIIDKIMLTFRRDGSVLVPVDVNGRVLELLLLLENHWHNAYGDSAPYNIVFLNEYAKCTVAMAEQALEFASDSLRHTFEARGINPLSFIQRGTVKFCTSHAELEAITGPKVVFATPSTANLGFALDLIIKYSANKKNLILLTGDVQGGDDAVTQKLRAYVGGDCQDTFFLEAHREVELPEEELQAWKEREQQRLDEESAAAELFRQRRSVREITEQQEADSDDDDEEDMDIEGAAAAAPGAGAAATDKRAAHLASGLSKLGATKTTQGLFLPKSMAYQSKHLMFPCVEDVPLEIDDFGESLDVEVIKRLAQTFSDETTSIERLALSQADAQREREMREWEEAEAKRPKTVDELTPPKKYEKQTLSVDVLAAVEYIPFEGVCDGSTLKHILTQNAHTQRIIIINSEAKPAGELTEYCKSHCTADVVRPGLGQRIDVTPSTRLYRVRVADKLVAGLRFHDARDYKIAVVSGSLQPGEDDALLPEAKRRKTDALPVLTTGSSTAGQRATFIGDLTLRELSSQMRNLGHHPEYRRGSLLCDKQLAVRRGDKGAMSLNGVLTTDWFQLRAALRKNFTVL
eukprot:TRINITY_DN5640_c1_g2_i1.p1 TRINITY_DN5640_c1_g2~~TRINITY_DN5640_c1_g2_i1.p1  ORF type:complete len:815 (+),score=356.91 TRINITY_DN5640_c1_g2_i1:129-2573(+)